MTMLKIELHRMTRAWYLWGILALLFLGTNAYPIGCGSYTIPEAPLIDISKNIVGPLIASGIYMGLVHSEDLYAGLTRYWIASGVSRTGILLARIFGDTGSGQFSCCCGCKPYHRADYHYRMGHLSPDAFIYATILDGNDCSFAVCRQFYITLRSQYCRSSCNRLCVDSSNQSAERRT